MCFQKRPKERGVPYINYGRDLVGAVKDCGSYISEQDRFYTDFAKEEKLRREQQFEKEETRLTRKRYEVHNLKYKNVFLIGFLTHPL